MARIIRLPEVCRLVGLSRSSVLRLERRGEFPPKFSLSVRSIGWYELDVLAWVQARAILAGCAPQVPAQERPGTWSVKRRSTSATRDPVRQ